MPFESTRAARRRKPAEWMWTEWLLAEFNACLRRNRIRVPKDLGVAVISQIIEKTPFSGLEENQALIGAWAVELLVARIMNRDLGIPTNPRIEMVERRWVAGKSLRRQRP